MQPFGFLTDLNDFRDRDTEASLSEVASHIVISKRQTMRLLFSCIVIFFAGHLLEWFLRTEHSIRMMNLNFWFGLDTERNIPTLFSGGLLFLSASLLALIAVFSIQLKQKGVRYWCGLSFLFFGLTIDEVLSFHERLIGVFKPIMKESALNIGIFHYAWVIPGIAFVGIVFLLFSRFLMRLSPQFRNAFLVSGAVYIAGALGLEMLNGAWISMNGNDFFYHVLTGIEELLEMSGIAIFIYTLLSYLQAQVKRVKISILD